MFGICHCKVQSETMTPLKSVIFFLTLWTKCLTDNTTQFQLDQVKRYLYEYEYLYTKDKTSLQLVNDSDVSNALLIFQEYYKLPADGKLNNETRNLMLKRRCGNTDILSDYRKKSFHFIFI